MAEQLLAFGGSEDDVRIEEQRCQIVGGEPGSQTLKIDQANFAIANDHVLTLEIAMHQAARLGRQLIGNLVETMPVDGSGLLKMARQAMFEKIILFPPIERRIENRLVRQRGGAFREMGAGVQRKRFIEGPLIKGASLDPGSRAKTPEIQIASVLHENQPFRLIMKMNHRDAHPDPGEEFRDGHIMPVLRAILAVTDENQGFTADVHPPEFSTRAAFVDRRDEHGTERDRFAIGQSGHGQRRGA